MQLFQDLFLLQRIDYLIRSRATGSPAELASRLSISERKVYRLIGSLRDQGFPITYDKQQESYCYAEPVKMEFSIVVGRENLLLIRGGESNAHNQKLGNIEREESLFQHFGLKRSYVN